MRLKHVGSVLLGVTLFCVGCAPRYTPPPPPPPPAPPPPPPPPLTEEDRPPIIVQEGSFQYEIKDASLTWKEKQAGSNRWIVPQDNPKSVVGFTVTISGKLETPCGPASGTRARIDFKKTVFSKDFFLTLHPEFAGSTKYEPVAHGEGDLSASGALLTHGDRKKGAIKKLHVDGQKICDFDSDDEPKITFEFKYPESSPQEGARQ